MKLHYKITVPVIIMLIAVISALTAVSYYFTESLINDNMSQLAQTKLDEVEKMILNKRGEASVRKQDINKEYINKAKVLANIIKQNPSIITNNAALFEMASFLGVDEIHITDENGVVRWGTIGSFYGMDYKNDENMMPFLGALTDTNFELMQDAKVRKSDNVLFQYIGVARIDKPGIVQIGVSPSKIQSELREWDLSTIAKDSTFGAGGSVIIIDKNSDVIISHATSSIMNEHGDKYEWGRRVRESEAGEFRYFVAGKELYLKYQTSGDIILCATIPVEEFTGGLSTLLRNSAMVSLAALLLSIIIISILLRKNITSEINKLLKAIKLIGEGDLTRTVNINSSREFRSLSEGINLMTGNLKEIIEKSFDVTNKLRESGQRLSSSAELSSKSAAEVATTVNELAAGANDQADGATKGALTAKNVLDKAEAVSHSIEDTVRSTELTKDTVLDGVKTIEFQNEKMLQSVESSKSLGDSVNELSQRANEIGDIINVITGIADQTNMLALNAAIEAARAGEVGRGFAVVADEVRKLAEGSTEAAHQISDIIVQIQSSIERAKEQAGNSITVIEEQQTAVRHTQEAFDKINDVTREAVDQVTRIAEATNDIISGIHKIVEVVESQAAASQESAAGTEEISASVQEQTAATEEVAHIANGLMEVVEELSALVNRFKV